MIPIADVIIILLLVIIVAKIYGYGFGQEENEDESGIKWRKNPLMPGGGYMEVPRELEHLFKHGGAPPEEKKPDVKLDGNYL